MGPAPESPPGYACQAPEAPGTPWGGGRSRLLGKERVQAGLVSEAVGNFRPSESESDRPRFAAIRRPIETLQSNWVRPGDPSTTFFHTFPGTFRARKGVPIPINPYQSVVRRRNLHSDSDLAGPASGGCFSLHEPRSKPSRPAGRGWRRHRRRHRTCPGGLGSRPGHCGQEAGMRAGDGGLGTSVPGPEAPTDTSPPLSRDNASSREGWQSRSNRGLRPSGRPRARDGGHDSTREESGEPAHGPVARSAPPPFCDSGEAPNEEAR